MIQDPRAQHGRRPVVGITPLAAQLRRAALPLASPDDLDPRQYDAFLFIDETCGVDPFHMPVTIEGEVPETYPSGM